MKRTYAEAGLGGSVPGFRSGDWFCGACRAHNYASKARCFKCGTPGSAVAGALSMVAYNAGSARRMNAGQGGGEMRVGDWICPACAAHNFRDKRACYKCSRTKPGFPMAPAARGAGPAMRYSAMPWSGQVRPTATRPSGYRAGDWICPSCRGHNYASKTACFKCHLAKPAHLDNALGNAVQGRLATAAATSAPAQVVLPDGFRPGDWICPKCSGHNYNSKKNCFKCRADKPALAEEASLALGGGFPPGFRTGDWLCAHCKAHNYASKSACYKCKQPKSNASVSDAKTAHMASSRVTSSVGTVESKDCAASTSMGGAIGQTKQRATEPDAK